MRRFVLALTLATLYAPRAAYGNGRFPKAQALAATSGDGGARTLYLRATFGVLVSRDLGRHWRWLCEDGYGTTSTWDPPMATTRDGRLWLGMPDGLRAVRDGCAVTDVKELAGQTVLDLTDDGKGELLFAATTSRLPAAAGAEGATAVWAQGASGHWEKRGTLKGLRADTFDVAPSNPARMYVTGIRDALGESTRESLFYRSDDGGRTFAKVSPVLPVAGRIYLAAIDPKDDGRILARILHSAGSELALSTDAGATFRVVLHTNGAMFGFAKDEGGQGYYAGSGDPKEGVFRSRDRGEHWEPGAKTSVYCLFADGPAALYACSNPFGPNGYAVAASSDLGVTFEPRSTFDDVEGAVACDAGPAATCGAQWPAARDAIRAGGAELEASRARARARLDGAREASVASADAASAAGAGDDAAPADHAAAPARDRTRACACRLSAPTEPGSRAPLALVALVVAGVVVRRRRNMDPP